MARFLEAVLCLAMTGMCLASQVRQQPIDKSEVDRSIADSICGRHTHTEFEKLSRVYRRDPGGVLESAREVVLRGANVGTTCLSSSNLSNHRVLVIIDANFAFGRNVAGCCSLEERRGMSVDNNGKLLNFAQTAFDKMGRGTLNGVDFLKITPDSCTHGCPLVVELPGNGGYPWLMVRSRCRRCSNKLGVLMVSPMLEQFDDTSLRWVNRKFMPFVQAYIELNRLQIDVKRVYLVSASRGTEIGLTAALAHPHLWKRVLTTGKFRFTDDMWRLVRTPGIFERAHKAGLASISFNIGDQDEIFSDEEYYSNLTSMLSVASKSGSGPNVRLIIYPYEGHGTSPGVWTKWSSVIWSGTTDSK